MKGKLKYISATSLLPEGKIDRPVVFVTENVVSKSAKERLQDIGYEVMPNVWNDKQRLEEANVYLEELYSRLEEKIGSVLSQIHEVDYPASFWQIPIASWLIHYLHILFDRYTRLKSTIKYYGRENISLLACKRDIKPSGPEDFIGHTSIIEQTVSAFYGLVAKEIGMPILEFACSEGFQGTIFIQQEEIGFFSKSFYTRLLNKLKDELLNPIPLMFFQGRDILMSPYQFNKGEKFIFSRKLKASFWPSNKKIRTTLQKVDRKVLLSITARDEFEKIAVDLLPKFMPRYLLEEFKSYKRQAERWDYFKVYFFRLNWWLDILFCYAASLGKLKDAKILGWQHGGGYGQYKRSSVEFMERHFCDYYITWGWKDSLYPRAELVPLPQPFSFHYLNRHRQKLATAIWVAISLPKHLYRFYSFNFTDNMTLCFKDKKKFVSGLNLKIRKSLIYRPYHYDYGWCNDEKGIFKDFPEVKLGYAGRLVELLQRVKLYICDHQGTSFLEALVINTPTILFWNTELSDERTSAVPAFDLLRGANILFHDPVKAAQQVNAIWDNVQGWWMHPDRQNARIKFIEAFYQTDINWQAKWIEAFRKILKKKALKNS